MMKWRFILLCVTGVALALPHPEEPLEREVQDNVEQLRKHVQDKVEQLREQVKDKAEQLKEHVQDKADERKNQLATLIKDDAKEKVSEGAEDQVIQRDRRGRKRKNFNELDQAIQRDPRGRKGKK